MTVLQPCTGGWSDWLNQPWIQPQTNRPCDFSSNWCFVASDTSLIQAYGKANCWRLGRRQQSAELDRQDVVVALNGDQFRSRTCTSYALYGTGANVEGVGEYGAHFVRGCVIDSPGPHAHLESAVVGATNAARGRPGMNPYGKSDHAERVPGSRRVGRNHIELF